MSGDFGEWETIDFDPSDLPFEYVLKIAREMVNVYTGRFNKESSGVQCDLEMQRPEQGRWIRMIYSIEQVAVMHNGMLLVADIDESPWIKEKGIDYLVDVILANGRRAPSTDYPVFHERWQQALVLVGADK